MVVTVSVLLAVKNASHTIQQAVESILTQSYQDFELLICADGSNAKTRNILQGYSDKRIKLYANNNSKGVSAARNLLYSHAKGKYIAIMDADDVSLPNRFAKQVAFLDANPNVGIVGNFVKIIPKIAIRKYPTHDTELKKKMLLVAPFANPTTMMRKAIIDELDYVYNSNIRIGEDLDLWFRLEKLTKFATIPEILLEYRQNPHSSSHRSIQRTLRCAAKIRLQYVQQKKYRLFYYIQLICSYCLPGILIYYLYRLLR